MATSKSKSTKNLPLDGGTFISLQKSAIEGDISMETKLHLLYELQKNDSKIDLLHRLRGELPEEVQDLEDSILGLKTKLDKIKSEILEADRTISNSKNDIESIKIILEKHKAQMNNLKNNKEYLSLEKEIENDELDIKLAEENIKRAQQFKTEKNAEFLESSKVLEDKEAELEQKRRELDVIIAENAIEEEALKKDSQEIQLKIDERMLAAYHKVRLNSRNGLAVVTVNRDSCSGCYNKIPAQRQLDIASNKKIIVCEYCGRILVSADFEKK